MFRTQFEYWNALMFGFAMLPALLSFYANYSILFLRFLAPRRIGGLLLANFVVAMCGTAMGQLILYSTQPGRMNWTVETIIGMGIVMMVNALLNGAVGLGFKSFFTWYDDLKWKEAYKRKNYEMELAMLKSQLNPHFLFNTINNIDVLITQDAEKASLYLNKLSDMLRFMLYETKTFHILLEKELAYIEKYISLQKIRTRNPDYVQYTVAGNAAGHQIAPMLFIPFIENAFKHSAPKKEGNVITIAITIHETGIRFTCTNHYLPGTAVEDGYNGLGNELIRKRLLLLYSDKHTLQVTDAHNRYTVALDLPLTHTYELHHH